MLNIDIENLSIIKDSNDEMLNYFNESYIDNLELIQALKTELFELSIKIEEIEKTKALYSYKSDTKRNLFSPIINDDNITNNKQRIFDNQLLDLYSAKEALNKRILHIEDSLNILQERLDKLQRANSSINILLDSNGYSSINESALDNEGFEFVEEPSEVPPQHTGYNILMLQEYQNGNIASTLNNNIKQQIINNNHKAEVLNWLLNSDISRAKLTLKEMLNSYGNILSDIDKTIDSLNYNIDTKQPIWMMIDNLIMEYRDNHPECIIEANTEYPDYEMNIHPVITINLINILRELLNNTFKHSNANRITLHIYISSHIIDVYINDNGVGINSDYLLVSNWYSGLHRVHQIVDLLDGNIKIEGDLISGTNVRFSFPISNVKH